MRVLITVIWKCRSWLRFWLPSWRPKVDCSHDILASFIFISIDDLY
jgi:hypothetical protein